MKTSKRDNVDITNLMQSIDQTEKVNVEAGKLPGYIDRLSTLAENFDKIAKAFEEIANKPIFLGIKKESFEEFHSEKNRYIEEEKETLTKHRTKMLKMLEEHEQKTKNIIRQGEGIWLSDFWMKVWCVVQLAIYVIICLCLTTKP